MDRERNYNLLRGCVLASGLELIDKQRLFDFLDKLESREKYMADGSENRENGKNVSNHRKANRGKGARQQEI